MIKKIIDERFVISFLQKMIGQTVQATQSPDTAWHIGTVKIASHAQDLFSAQLQESCNMTVNIVQGGVLFPRQKCRAKIDAH